MYGLIEGRRYVLLLEVLKAAFILFCLGLFLRGISYGNSAVVAEKMTRVQTQKTLHPFPSKLPNRICANQLKSSSRPRRFSIKDFGAVDDGVTLNTQAFQNAIVNISSYRNHGGAQLYVPAGKWLTGSFNLTSKLTLFLDKGAVILGSQDPRQWPIIDPLPSYGRGRELPGGRHISLIYGHNLTDVVVTGDNGTIDGQGAVWWALFRNKSLDYTRGPLVEFMDSKDIVISNLTFKDAPFWNIHPVYCKNVHIQNLTILAPRSSPNTDGIDPDSSSHVCIEDCFISNGDDLIAIKSGWDEYGIAYGRPSEKIVIRRISGDTRASSGIALGSEMSGGISDVYVDGLEITNGGTGIRVKSAAGRGGYIRNVHVSNVKVMNVKTAIGFTNLYGDHPDNLYNPDALPCISRIFIENVEGHNVSIAGNFQGLEKCYYRDIFLKSIHLEVTSQPIWNCSYLHGSSEFVYPRQCSELLNQSKVPSPPCCSCLNGKC